MQSTSIENLLIDWGRAERQLPPNNAFLKSQLLGKFDVPLAPVAPKKIFRMPWLSLACASLAVVILLLQIRGKKLPQPFILEPLTSSTPQKQSAIGEKQKPAELDAPKSDSVNKTMRAPFAGSLSAEQPKNNTPQIYSPPANQEISISDNREFLKTNYSARMQTRHVGELTQQLQTVIRGFGGRVDAANSSANGGFIGFAVPASRFDAFKLAAKNLAGAKFYVENQSSQNLLSEKQSIEQNQNSAQNAITQLEADREKLTADHNRRVAAFKTGLNNVAQELMDLNSQLPPWSEAYLQRQQELLARRKSLQAQLASENANYDYQINSLDAQIQNNQALLKNLGEQDSNLLNTATTVRGTISLESINFLQVINAYFALYWITLILFAAAVISYLARRRNRLIIP